jgi:hypothetical protein
MSLPTKQHLLQKHGLPSLFVSAMVLAGYLVNFNDNDAPLVDSNSTWCDNFETFRDAPVEDMPKGFQELTIAISAVLPMVPTLLNSRNDWSDYKIEIIKSHILGQSSSFGISEIARHFTNLPEAQFFKKCNLTYFDCKQKSLQSNLLLVSDDKNASFCNANATNKLDLMGSLHYFPASAGSLIGAGLVSFIASLMYWHHVNKEKKSLYENSPLKKYILYLCIGTIVIIFFMYCVFLYKTFNTFELYAVFSGGFLQTLIILALLGKNEQ